MNNFFKSLLALSISGALASTANSAVYEVIDKGAAETHKYTYGQKFNNAGQMGISGTELYNFPVQYGYFEDADYDSIVNLAAVYHDQTIGINDIEDETALRAGEPVPNDLYWVVNYLQRNAGSLFYQQVGTSIVMTNLDDANGTEEVTIFDSTFLPTENPDVTVDTSLLTNSTTEFINGITDSGWIYGNASAPYLNYYYEPVDLDPDDESPVADPYDYFIRDFTTRAFFSPDNGATVYPVLPPTEETDNPARHYGGESAIIGMSGDNTFAVGYASVALDEDKVTFIENTGDDDETEEVEPTGCNDPEVLAVQPLELCIAQQLDNMYYIDASKWTIDENFNATRESLGILVTPDEEDLRTYVSIAQAVNNQGVTVGYSHGWVDEEETDPAATEARNFYAVMFKDGVVKSFTPDHSTHFDSRAYDINDEGIAVGHTTTYINGTPRTKAYYVDTNVENPEFVIPDSYFNGASSTARAININGKFVGEGEVETHNDNSNNPRRREAYLFEINELDTEDDDKLYNLNDLINTCEVIDGKKVSTQKYTIVEARDINDANEIAATALIETERRDATGAIMYDENEDALTEDVIRAVLLVPKDGGEIEECFEDDELVERQGASFGLFGFFALFGLSFTRRLFQK